MKIRTIALFISALLSTHVFSQIEEETKPKAFLGINSGINHIGGMFGIHGEVNVVNNFSVIGSAGLGGWGTKASIGIKYNRNYPYGTHFILTYSSASGIKDFKLDVETEANDETMNQGGTQEVTFDLKTARNINLIVGYSWKLFQRSRFNLDFGYSVPMQDKAYAVISDHVLTKDSDTMMGIMTPGGLILGLGFSFSL
ncbi:MAG: hypothetical protein JEZ09_06785 [Salinivirgaceae bacterium]|nr:hypothetical protein [Salinivirgaceae bacterium]